MKTKISYLAAASFVATMSLASANVAHAAVGACSNSSVTTVMVLDTGDVYMAGSNFSMANDKAALVCNLVSGGSTCQAMLSQLDAAMLAGLRVSLIFRGPDTGTCTTLAGDGRVKVLGVDHR
jgi:hypothetical protein